MPHAKKYFANILLPYSSLILKLVEQVTALGLEFDMICPDHGVIWRQDPAKIIQAYVEWSKQEPEKKAVVIYDTMWHSTEKMAIAIAAGLIDSGVTVKPMHLRKWHRSDIMTEVMEARAVIIGSPTLNNGLYPTVSDFLTYMKGLKPKNKIGTAFGSYGWSGEAAKLILKELEAIKIEIVVPELRLQYLPDTAGTGACFELGAKIGQAILG
jgi:flavorubredoxin